MKVITFFSEKGGTGKTTLTLLMASYLAYERGERVFVMDCDYPSYQFSKMRETDVSMLVPENRDFIRAVGTNVPYRIGQIKAQPSFSQAELERIAESLKAQTKGDGYFFLDLPGRFLPTDPAYHLMFRGLVDLVVFPVDSDRQSRSSALFVGDLLRSDAFRKSSGKKDGQQMCVLWNRETQRERIGKKDWYDVPTRTFESVGMPVIGQRVHDILIARRDPNTFGFIRSTLCWPKQNIRRQAPYLETVFEEIKLRADGKWNEKARRRLYGETQND